LQVGSFGLYGVQGNIRKWSDDGMPLTAMPCLPYGGKADPGLTFIRLRHKFASEYNTRPLEKIS